MEELVTLIMGEVLDPTLITEFTVMVRVLVFSLVIEMFGVYVSHLSSIGR